MNPPRISPSATGSAGSASVQPSSAEIDVPADSPVAEKGEKAPPLIVFRDVTKQHRQGEAAVWALRGVSGEIASGSFTFILGPSGSGKSTLLYLLGALEEPTSGEILVRGQSLSSFTRRQRDAYRRCEVGFVFQNFNLLSNLDAVNNVLVPFLPQGITPDDRQRAEEVLCRVGLGNRLSHRPHQLSGGEQQRVAIARAIFKRPRLLLADEPTGELDSRTGHEVFGLLRSLHEEQGTTVVVVTHDERYLTTSDTVWKLSDGRRVFSSEASEDDAVR